MTLAQRHHIRHAAVTPLLQGSLTRMGAAGLRPGSGNGGKGSTGGEVAVRPPQDLPAVEAAAVAGACERLIVLCHSAARFGLSPPAAAGWQPLEDIVLSIAAGEAPGAPDFPPPCAHAAALTSSASSALLASGEIVGVPRSPRALGICAVPFFR